MNELTNDNIKSLNLDLLNKSYSSEIKQFMIFSNSSPSPESIIAYMDKLNNEKVTASKYNKNLYAIKDLIKRVILNDPDLTNLQRYEIDRFLNTIKGKKRSSGERAITKAKTLSMNELVKLLENCSNRLAYIIRFLLKTGLRVSELCSIKLSDCKDIDSTVYIRVTGKGNKERTIRVHKSFYIEIRAYFEGRKYLFETTGGNAFNSRNIDKELRRQSNNIISRQISPHMLRHTFATMAIKETKKIKAVSEYLGHSTTAITQDMYNHETLDEIELFDFMNKF